MPGGVSGLRSDYPPCMSPVKGLLEHSPKATEREETTIPQKVYPSLFFTICNWKLAKIAFYT